MEKRMRAESGNDVERKWVHDHSVDFKGRVPLRASTGAWKASLFIIALEFSERLSFFALAANLISYLTKVIRLDLKTAAKVANYWTGVTTTMPLLGGFLADAYTGRFFMVLMSSFVYLMGLILLTMSEFIPSMKPCAAQSCLYHKKIHKVIFFLSIYLLSLGTGGLKPCLESFGADQFDDNHSEERKKKMSYFNWWNFVLCCGFLLGVTVLVYIQDYVSWGTADLVLMVTMAISIIIFIAGRPKYRYMVPEGSPLTPLLQVFVAAIRKRNLPHPPSHDFLYEVPSSETSQGRLLCHTNRLSFLDKAAIVEEEDGSSLEKERNPWQLATVTKVEELKLVLNTIPIWLTTMIFGICFAQSTTFFVKQGATMNRKIATNFEIPPASIGALGAAGMLFSVTAYEKIVEPVARRATGHERGVKILQRIGIGMVFPVISMGTAAFVERKRLKAFESLSMSVFWLAPQYLILGIGEGLTLVGLQEYFYDQVPDSMRSLGIALFLSVIGVGSFLSSFLITLVDHVTKTAGHSWFGKDLNSSRLDKFYWLLAALCGVNLCVYVLLTRRYTYKNVKV